MKTFYMCDLPPVSNERAKSELRWEPAVGGWWVALLDEARASPCSP